jgi:hypothetical protein
MRRALTLTTVALALLAAGCNKEPASAVVEKVKGDGAGEVEKASLDSITQWMWKKGTPYADALWLQCEPLKKAGDATWGGSTEGRVCTAAQTVRMNSSRPIQGDPRRY